MLIDWFTVGAQALNFLILFWLLKRFLFGPIRNAIEERQKAISNTLAEAAATKLEAETERTHFQDKSLQLEKEREDILAQAVTSAQAEKAALLKQARQAADELSQSRLESLRSQEEKLHSSLRERAQKEALSLARDILQTLSGVELESRSVEIFLQRLEGLEEVQRETLKRALKDGGGKILVRSAWEFTPEHRETLEAGVEKILAQSPRWSYLTDPELLSGFELAAEGHKLSWSGAGLLAQVMASASSGGPGHAG